MSETSTPITVVLADDHELVRDGIRMVIEAERIHDAYWVAA